jgi:hypothetical protein
MATAIVAMAVTSADAPRGFTAWKCASTDETFDDGLSISFDSVGDCSDALVENRRLIVRDARLVARCATTMSPTRNRANQGLRVALSAF